MLKKALITTSLVACMSLSLMAQGNGHGHKGHGKQHKEQITTQHIGKKDLLHNVTVGELSDEQKEGMSYIIEEEKVARDVYLSLSKTWNSRIFKNIAKSEQKHIDAVAKLFSKYEIDSPSTLEYEGVFENDELQKLYDNLVAKGETSLLSAYEVGVIVEETDIADLEDLLNSDISSDFERVYSNLLKGSNKHLDAFNRQVLKQK